MEECVLNRKEKGHLFHEPVWTQVHLKGKEDLNCLLISLKSSQLLRVGKGSRGGTEVQDPEKVP